MRKFFLFIVFAWFTKTGFNQLTPFEKGGKNVSATYWETIAFYKELDRKSANVSVKEMGQTDANLPLHLVLVSSDGKMDPKKWHEKAKTIILINNGIHPGEPDGIDASMMLVRDIVNGTVQLPASVCLAIIPVYNIGGCLNRSSNYRVDQNGPEAFGFRGNSQNLDLNRDFIKCDSKEARSFAEIFHFLDPDIFIDNHVSNGADYQHVMTLLTSQHNKLGGEMGEYLQKKMEPAIFQLMKTKGYDLVPYVNFYGETPEQGWTEYFDGPRYSSGFATLWSSFAFVPETHMLKPYWQRVDATYKLMQSFIEFAATDGLMIQFMRVNQKLEEQQKKKFDIEWTLDKTQKTEIEFKGFEAGHKPSLISGQPRLYYDRTKPFTKKIPFLNTFVPSLTINKPRAYIIPQGWWKVIELLRINKVEMHTVSMDSTITVERYRISEYKSGANPYEAHHGNSNVKVETETVKIQFRKGDMIIFLNQAANRFLMETLEPQGNDSYFAWNFFDGILGQKEGYSGYVFEETAEQVLNEDPGLRSKLEAKQKTDEKFAKNGADQLDYIYRNSKYFEPVYLKYPVYRVMQ
jgi:hypothetical protein